MINILTSVKFALVCGILICAIAVGGSFSPHTAVVYKSWFFAGLWILFSVSLLTYIIQLIKRPKRLYQWGLIIMHAGILAMLLSTAANRIWGLEGNIHLLEGMEQSAYLLPDDSEAELGFTVKCDDFNVEYYGDSNRVKAYTTLLSVDDGTGAVIAEIGVNQPFTYKGVTFYQQSYGFSPNNEGRLLFTAELNGEKSEHSVFFDEPVSLADGVSVEIVDFSPALALRPDGQAYNFSEDYMFNPSSLFLIDRQGERFYRWVSTRSADSGQIDEDFTLIFNDFKGVEYTTLAIAKKPFSAVIYISFVIMALGFIMIYVPRMRKTQ